MNYQYNWEKQPEVIEFLNRIYLNTCVKLSEQKKSGIIPYETAQKLTFYLEDFLYIVMSQGYNFERIFKLLSTLQCFEIKNVSSNVQDYTPKIILSSILFNTIDIKNADKLEKNQRKYLYKGLTEHVLKFKNATTENFSRIYSYSLPEYKNNAQILVNNGWLLLEDVLSDEIAERFTHVAMNEPRVSSNINQNYYQITLLFGATLSRIGSLEEYSDSVIMYGLIKKALNGKFSNEVISEYFQNGKEFKLYQILYVMGILFNEYSRRFPYISLSEREYEELSRGLCGLLASLITFEQETYSGDFQLIPCKLNQIEQEKMKMLIKDRKFV